MDKEGKPLGAVTALDALANRHRKRITPAGPAQGTIDFTVKRTTPTLVKLACAEHYKPLAPSEKKVDEADEFTAKGL